MPMLADAHISSLGYLCFDWEKFGVLDWRSLMGGGHLQEVVAHGGSTVVHFKNNELN